MLIFIFYLLSIVFIAALTISFPSCCVGVLVLESFICHSYFSDIISHQLLLCVFITIHHMHVFPFLCLYLSFSTSSAFTFSVSPLPFFLVLRCRVSSLLFTSYNLACVMYSSAGSSGWAFFILHHFRKLPSWLTGPLTKLHLKRAAAKAKTEKYR